MTYLKKYAMLATEQHNNLKLT